MEIIQDVQTNEKELSKSPSDGAGEKVEDLTMDPKMLKEIPVAMTYDTEAQTLKVSPIRFVEKSLIAPPIQNLLLERSLLTLHSRQQNLPLRLIPPPLTTRILLYKRWSLTKKRKRRPSQQYCFR